MATSPASLPVQTFRKQMPRWNLKSGDLLGESLRGRGGEQQRDSLGPDAGLTPALGREGQSRWGGSLSLRQANAEPRATLFSPMTSSGPPCDPCRQRVLASELSTQALGGYVGHPHPTAQQAPTWDPKPTSSAEGLFLSSCGHRCKFLVLSSDFMASSIQLVPEAELGNLRRAWAWRLTDERITAFLPPHSLPWPPAAATTQRTPTSLASSLLRIASQGTLTSSTTCNNIEISAYKHPKKIWLRVWGDIGESPAAGWPPSPLSPFPEVLPRLQDAWAPTRDALTEHVQVLTWLCSLRGVVGLKLAPSPGCTGIRALWSLGHVLSSPSASVFHL